MTNLKSNKDDYAMIRVDINLIIILYSASKQESKLFDFVHSKLVQLQSREWNLRYCFCETFPTYDPNYKKCMASYIVLFQEILIFELRMHLV